MILGLTLTALGIMVLIASSHIANVEAEAPEPLPWGDVVEVPPGFIPRAHGNARDTGRGSNVSASFFSPSSETTHDKVNSRG